VGRPATGDDEAASRRDRRTRVALVVYAAALWLLLLGFSRTDLTLPRRSAQLVFFFSAYVVFVAAVRLVWRRGSGASRRTVLFVVLAGITLRLTLAPMRPVTTSDIYRYIWEGEVIDAGRNPFLDPPDSPALAPLRDWIWARVQMKDVPAAYPPVAQYVFALAARLREDKVIALKLVLALFDAGTVLLLPGLLVRLGRPPAWTLLYAWHPLVVGEVVARGHLDSIGIFFLVLAARLAAGRGRGGLSSPRCAAVGAAAAAAVLAKGYALFAAPFLILGAVRAEADTGRSARRALWLAAGFVAVVVAAYLPFAGAGWSLLRGIGLYGRRWHGYAPVYPLLDAVLGWFVSDPTALARWVLAAAFAAWMLRLLLEQRRAAEPAAMLDGVFRALAGFFLLSPVLYPWYLAWTVPFLCLRPRPGWLLLTGAAFTFYGHALAGPRAELWWLSVLEYGLPLVLAGVCLRRERGQERREGK